MKRIVIDIESNGFLMQATEIWVVCVRDLDSGNTIDIYSRDELQSIITSAEKIIGHNIMCYDLPLLNRLWGIEYDWTRVIDTLLVSRLLHPDRPGGHSLAEWGERIGVKKQEFKDFSKFSEEMVTYCRQDVAVTEAVYRRLQSEARAYLPRLVEAIQLEHKYAYVIAKQMVSGFPFDIEDAYKYYDELKQEHSVIYEEIKQLLPPVRQNTHYKSIVEKGNLISETEKVYTYIQDKTRKVVTKEFKFEEANPGSRQQLIRWLLSKGWRPTEFTEKGTPEINETILLGLNTPESKKIARMLQLTKYMGMVHDGVQGWTKCYNKNTGRIHGNVNTNSTNTGRASHSSPNISQVSKVERMRRMWVAPEGRVIVGSDAAGLELRVLGHYLARYDKGAFAHEVVNGDIHTFNQKAAGLDQRNSAKTLIYALIYGAGDEKLGTVYTDDQSIFNSSEDELRRYGGGLRKKLLEGIDGYKELTSDVKGAIKERGYLIGIDGRPLHPRNEYSALNLLIQSTGALICKEWYSRIYFMALDKGLEYGKHWEFHVQSHDEFVASVVPELVNAFLPLSEESMKSVQKDFKMRVELSTEIKTGKSWYCVH